MEPVIVASSENTGSHRPAGIVGRADFARLQAGDAPVNVVSPTDSMVWETRDGAVSVGCRYRGRRCGAVLASGTRVMAYFGNLGRRAVQVQQILACDDQQIPELNEIFSLALWDGQKQELLLATDRYGNLPLFYLHRAGKLQFASEVKSLLSLPGERTGLNRQVLAELLAFECPLTDETLFEGIRKVPPGTILRFSRTGVREERYWSLRFQPAPPGEKLAVLDLADECFSEALGRACSAPRTAIALTGGIDTRAMLAAVMKRGLKVDTFTTGVANAADMSLATQLSSCAGGTHHRLVVGQWLLDDFERHAREIVRLAEGGITLHHTHLLSQVMTVPKWFDVLVDGGCVEVSKRGPLRRASRGLKPDDDLPGFIMKAWGDMTLLKALLAGEESVEAEERLRRKVAGVCADVGQEHTHDTIDAFFMRVVWPNRYGPQVALQNNFLEGQLPFLDHWFMDAVARLRVEWREKALFQFYAVQKNAPQLKRFGRVFANLRVPWVDEYLPKYVLPGLNLVWTRLGLPGFDRPNFPTRRWWRRELNGRLNRAFRTLDERGVFGPARVSALLRPGAVSPASLDRAASVLWMIELWLEEFT